MPNPKTNHNKSTLAIASYICVFVTSYDD